MSCDSARRASAGASSPFSAAIMASPSTAGLAYVGKAAASTMGHAPSADTLRLRVGAVARLQDASQWPAHKRAFAHAFRTFHTGV